MAEINMKKYTKIWLMIIVSAILFSCNKLELPHTANTERLISELLLKLDSTDVYAARKEAHIQLLKDELCGKEDTKDRFSLLFNIGREYATYSIDSAQVYLELASLEADKFCCDSLRYKAQFIKASVLSAGGFYVESLETLQAIPRSSVRGELFESYYSAWASLYHELYASKYEPEAYKTKYREKYNNYRDSILLVSDTTSQIYLKNIERKEARAGNFAEAKRYNDIRVSKINDYRSPQYASCLYDRYMITAYYEGNTTGEAIDDLFKSAIIEIENSCYDIASLLRVEEYLYRSNRIKEAKKVSDHYYSSLQFFGSRKRLVDGGDLAINISNGNYEKIHNQNRVLLISIIFTSLLIIALLFLLYVLRKYNHKISRLNKKLHKSGKISTNYVGVIFKHYSSYIKRLDAFRMKLHTSLRKGNIDNALEMTKISGESSSEERRILFQNFDSAFIDIYPNFIQTVNSCLKEEAQIKPKSTEILNNELRIVALNKLGIEDYKEIAELLHCSIKTVYNLRSTFKARLAISEKSFNRTMSKL